MLLHCTIIREGGTVVDIPPSTRYHFRPRDDGKHVAEVNNPAHIKLFLAASSYEMVGEDDDAEEDADEQRERAVARLTAPASVPASDPDASPAVPQGGEAPITGEQGEDADPEDDADDGDGEVIEAMDAPGDADGDEGEAEDAGNLTQADMEEMDDEELADLHEITLGKLPHPNAKRAKIIRDILAHQQPEG